MPRESNFASCYRLHFLTDNNMAWGETSTWTYCWKPTINDKPCSKPALKIIKAQPCIPWHFGLSLERKHQPLAIPNSSKASWLTGLGQCLGGRREAELEFNSGEHWSKVTSAVWNFLCAGSGTALAEPFVLVNELTAEKLELCPHHILPLTLHPILVPLRSALVELEEKQVLFSWKQALLFFF